VSLYVTSYKTSVYFVFLFALFTLICIPHSHSHYSSSAAGEGEGEGERGFSPIPSVHYCIANRQAGAFRTWNFYEEGIQRCRSVFPARSAGMLDLADHSFYPTDLLPSRILEISAIAFGVAANGRDIEPDYTKPAEKAYISITRYFLTFKRSFCLFGLIEANRSGSLPTWVPDWRIYDKTSGP